MVTLGPYIPRVLGLALPSQILEERKNIHYDVNISPKKQLFFPENWINSIILHTYQLLSRGFAPNKLLIRLHVSTDWFRSYAEVRELWELWTLSELQTLWELRTVAANHENDTCFGNGLVMTLQELRTLQELWTLQELRMLQELQTLEELWTLRILWEVLSDIWPLILPTTRFQNKGACRLTLMNIPPGLTREHPQIWTSFLDSVYPELYANPSFSIYKRRL